MKEFNDITKQPPLDSNFLTCSVDIDILTENGEIKEKGFYTTAGDFYFDNLGNRLKNVKGWRLSEECL